MSNQVFERTVELPVSADEAFTWHERPGALERLLPPWQRVEVLEHTGTIRDGDRVVMRMHAGPLWVTWVAEHRGYVPGRQFVDVQVKGPFKRWEHTHRFEPLTASTCRLTDHIEFETRGASPLRVAGVMRQLEAYFTHRHRLTRDDLLLHNRFRDQPRKAIAMTGASGLLGRSLTALLTTGGHTVVPLVRGSGKGGIRWDPRSGVIDVDKLAGVDAVVHLAGESVAGLWTKKKREAIVESRAVGTRVLAESLAKLSRRPEAMICASAIGFYPSAGDAVIDESTPPGDGFLATTCQAWERGADPARAAGIRVCHVRIGLVLTPAGGALGAMLTPFRLGLGGVLGPGTQWMPWIGLDDVISVFYAAIMDSSMSGVYNATAPEPVTNRVFTKTLGRVLHRPTLAAVPTFVLRAGGQMAEEMLLASQRVVPARLRERGFSFRDVELEPMLRRVLGRGDRL